MWHRLSLNYSLVVMPDGIDWSRGHEDSESSKLFPDPTIAYHYLLIRRQFLMNSDCPLAIEVRSNLVANLAWIQLKLIIKVLIRLEFKVFKRIRSIDKYDLLDLLRISLKWLK